MDKGSERHRLVGCVGYSMRLLLGYEFGLPLLWPGATVCCTLKLVHKYTNEWWMDEWIIGIAVCVRYRDRNSNVIHSHEIVIHSQTYIYYYYHYHYYHCCYYYVVVVVVILLTCFKEFVIQVGVMFLFCFFVLFLFFFFFCRVGYKIQRITLQSVIAYL